MLLRALALLISVQAMMACSSLRKLTHVETRELASVRTEEAVSPLRDQVAHIEKFAKSCPKEVVELLPVLAHERVVFPPCPEKLVNGFEVAKEALRTEERTTIEELLGSQCRTLPDDFGSSPLDSLIEGVVPRPARGGRSHDESGEATTEEILLHRMRLRDGLLEVRALHEPLEQWIHINGEFVMPEEELLFFERLVGKEHCKMSDQEVDQSYRTLHGLEALARVHAENEPQRKRIEHFLTGVHIIIDRKIKEYFTR
jgi:hypothetical protein